MTAVKIALGAFMGFALTWIALVGLSMLLFGGPSATLPTAGWAAWTLLVALATAGGGIAGGCLAARPSSRAGR